MSSRKIHKPKMEIATVNVRPNVPKSFNWISLTNHGDLIFLNLDQIYEYRGLDVLCTGGAMRLQLGLTAADNLRAHLEMIGLNIDHAAEIQRGAVPPAPDRTAEPGCACLTPAPPAPPARMCRVCGCTDDHACVNIDGDRCHWVEEELCSACSVGSDGDLFLHERQFLEMIGNSVQVGLDKIKNSVLHIDREKMKNADDMCALSERTRRVLLALADIADDNGNISTKDYVCANPDGEPLTVQEMEELTSTFLTSRPAPTSSSSSDSPASLDDPRMFPDLDSSTGD